MPPPPPRDMTFHERSQYDFTITWRAPELTQINSEPVVKYALELSVSGASGTCAPAIQCLEPIPQTGRRCAMCRTILAWALRSRLAEPPPG
eukprot:6100504-Prymnesium_polylepis.1